jgi:acetyl esterase/lipase
LRSGNYLFLSLPPFHESILKQNLRIIELATTTPAIVISPAYRLLPESSGADILADVSTFFTWLHTSFSSSLRAALAGEKFPAPDLTRIAAVGESAGGYLSIQAGLLFNAHARLKAVGAAYPAQYPDAEAYNARKLGNAEAEAVVDGYLERVRNGEMPIRVSSPWPRGKELVEAMCATGRHREMMGRDERLGIRGATRIAREGSWDVPAVWIIQGEDDDLVSFVLSYFLDSKGRWVADECRFQRRERTLWWK